MSELNNKLKVLIISLEYSPVASGGVGTQVEELSTGLALAGDSVTVIAGTVGRPKQFVEGNKTVHLVPPNEIQPPRQSVTQGILGYNCTLAAYARKIISEGADPPDIINCENWISYPAAVEISRATGAPVVCTIHYLSHPVERWWGQIPDPEVLAEEENLFRTGDTFIAVSRSIRSLMRDVYSVPEHRIHVIYNAVNAKAFLRTLTKEELERLRNAVSPANQKIVLYAGRFHPMKGITALLKSAVRVLQEEPNVRYLMAGEPDSKAYALEFCELLNQNAILKQKLTVLGKVSRRRLAVLYSVADVALVPSVYEPCGYAAIEAMVAGVPLVVSDGGGLAEHVEHGVNGLKVPILTNELGLRSADPEDLAYATLMLLRDQDLAGKLAKAARQKAAETYSTEVMVQATRDAYLAALTRVRSNVA